MVIRLVSDTTNVVQFPREKTERATIEMVVVLAPPRSLVDSLMAERGLRAHDAQAGMMRELAHQARTLDAGHDRDEAIVRLRALVDAHVAHAVQVCRAYRIAGDTLIRVETEAARALRVEQHMRLRLSRARELLCGRAIAARAAADAALGAVTALATYILEGVDGLAVIPVEPRQLSLFAALAS